jgi:iron-sulfur cluster repair di-iron protein
VTGPDDLTALSLEQLIAAHPRWLEVLEHFGLNVCCESARTLAAACRARSLSLDEVSSALRAAASVIDTGGWTDLDPVSLAAHVVSAHHQFEAAEIGELLALAGRVASGHGDSEGALDRVRALLREARAAFANHLMATEQRLFPAIGHLAQGRIGFAFGSVTGLVRELATANEQFVRAVTSAGAAMRAAGLGTASNCPSTQRLLSDVQRLERDVILHVRKENTALFPALVRLEMTLLTPAEAAATVAARPATPARQRTGVRLRVAR